MTTWQRRAEAIERLADKAISDASWPVSESVEWLVRRNAAIRADLVFGPMVQHLFEPSRSPWRYGT
jgi:hypothetical protein